MNIFFSHIEDSGGQYSAHDMHTLAGNVQYQASSLWLHCGDGSPRLHRSGHHAIVDQFQLYYVRGLIHCRGGRRRVAGFPSKAAVIRCLLPYLCHTATHRLVSCNYGGQFFIFDPDRFGSVLGLHGGFSHYHCHRITYMANPSCGQRRSWRHDTGRLIVIPRRCQARDIANAIRL